MAELSKTKNVHQVVLLNYIITVINAGYGSGFAIYYKKELIGNTDILDISKIIIDNSIETYDFKNFMKDGKELNNERKSNLSMLILLYLRELDLIDKDKFENIKAMKVNLQFPIVWQLYKENLNYAELNEASPFPF